MRREGRLFAAIGLALIFLPGVIAAVIVPQQSAASILAGGPSTWLILAIALIGLVGQLAMIRLALGPATSVRDSIVHGATRMPFYLVATLIWVAPLLICMLVFGKPLADNPAQASGIDLLISFLVLIALLYLTVRLILISAVASAENVGPIAMLKRAWVLSKGNWWRLLAFVLMLGIAAIAFLGAVGAITGILAGLLFGAVEPMSLAALFVAFFSEIASTLITILFIVMVARLYAQASGPASFSVPSSGT